MGKPQKPWGIFRDQKGKINRPDEGFVDAAPLVHVPVRAQSNGPFYFSPKLHQLTRPSPHGARLDSLLARFSEPSGTCSQRCSPDGQKHPVTGFHYTIQTCCELMGGAACQHVPAPERQSRALMQLLESPKGPRQTLPVRPCDALPATCFRPGQWRRRSISGAAMPQILGCCCVLDQHLYRYWEVPRPNEGGIALAQVLVRQAQAQAQTIPQKWVPNWASQLRLSAHPRARRGPLAGNPPPKRSRECCETSP
ncbi:hypothetical protein GGI35DRAFT_91752 [Trichoderma velutinum]